MLIKNIPTSYLKKAHQVIIRDLKIKFVGSPEDAVFIIACRYLYTLVGDLVTGLSFASEEAIQDWARVKIAPVTCDSVMKRLSVLSSPEYIECQLLAAQMKAALSKDSGGAGAGASAFVVPSERTAIPSSIYSDVGEYLSQLNLTSAREKRGALKPELDKFYRQPLSKEIHFLESKPRPEVKPDYILRVGKRKDKEGMSTASYSVSLDKFSFKQLVVFNGAFIACPSIIESGCFLKNRCKELMRITRRNVDKLRGSSIRILIDTVCDEYKLAEPRIKASPAKDARPAKRVRVEAPGTSARMSPVWADVLLEASKCLPSLSDDAPSSP